jgi:hypothetical protein
MGTIPLRPCVAGSPCRPFAVGLIVNDQLSMPPRIRDAQYWLERAEEARIHAEHMVDPEAKRQTLEIAAGYRRLAKYVQERSSRNKSRA